MSIANDSKYLKIYIRRNKEKIPLVFVDGALDLSQAKEDEYIRWRCMRCGQSEVVRVKTLLNKKRLITEKDLMYCDWCKGWIYGKVQGRDF